MCVRKYSWPEPNCYKINSAFFIAAHSPRSAKLELCVEISARLLVPHHHIGNETRHDMYKDGDELVQRGRMMLDVECRNRPNQWTMEEAKNSLKKCGRSGRPEDDNNQRTIAPIAHVNHEASHAFKAVCVKSDEIEDHIKSRIHPGQH